MCSRFQFVPRAMRVIRSARCVPLGVLAGMILFCPLLARADNPQSSAIGRLEGRDISIDNGTQLGAGGQSSGSGLYVANGSVVTVHSGQGRMTLFAGGQVDICGPAKLTVLLSGGAVTLALNFGRVRVTLPAKTALRIFTPTIIGTPLDIAGGARDVTVGLNLDDSLCVLATSGAIQLEHQFTGEKLIVPQEGEFFLNSGRLLPVAGTPGSCQCLSADLSPATQSPDYAKNEMPSMPPQATPPPSALVPAAPALEAAKPNLEYSMLAQANEAHPVSPPAKNAAPAAPPSSMPVYTAVLPPLTYMAGSPTRPPDATADMVLLVREARVSPEWEFSGHVEPPEFAEAVQQALGEGGRSSQAQPENPPAAEPAKKRGGFWGALKRVFGGGGS